MRKCGGGFGDVDPATPRFAYNSDLMQIGRESGNDDLARSQKRLVVIHGMDLSLDLYSEVSSSKLYGAGHMGTAFKLIASVSILPTSC
jgi:hypothetical protein